MYLVLKLYLFLLIKLVFIRSTNLLHDDSTMFSIKYNKWDDFNENMIKENNILNFTTPDKEKYLCVLPIVKTEVRIKKIYIYK